MSGVSLGSSPGMIFLVSFSFSWAGIFYSNSSILIDSTISVSVFCFAHDHFVFLVPPLLKFSVKLVPYSNRCILIDSLHDLSLRVLCPHAHTTTLFFLSPPPHYTQRK